MKNKKQRMAFYETLCKEKLGIQSLSSPEKEKVNLHNVNVVQLDKLAEVLEEVYENGFLDGSKFLP